MSNGEVIFDYRDENHPHESWDQFLVRKLSEQKTPQAQTQGMTTPDGAPIQGVPDNVSTAMTRNYGDLMKAIDKKKGK